MQIKNEEFFQNILIVLPLNHSSCFELLYYLSLIYRKLLEKNLKICFKKHPSMKEVVFQGYIKKFNFCNYESCE